MVSAEEKVELSQALVTRFCLVVRDPVILIGINCICIRLSFWVDHLHSWVVVIVSVLVVHRLTHVDGVSVYCKVLRAQSRAYLLVHFLVDVMLDWIVEVLSATILVSDGLVYHDRGLLVLLLLLLIDHLFPKGRALGTFICCVRVTIGGIIVCWKHLV